MTKMRFVLASALAAVASPALAQNDAALIAVPAAATTSVAFELFLPLRNIAALENLLEEQQKVGSPSFHKWLSPAEFARQFGPTAETIAAAQAAIQGAGLSVTQVNTRSLRVSGTAGSVARVLGASLGTIKGADGRSRLVATGKVVLSPALQAIGAQVVNFSGVIPHRPFATQARATALPNNRSGADGPYWFTDLKQAYDYPAYNSILPDGKRLDGTGTRAAVLMADLIYPGDVAAFFNHENFTAVSGSPVPTITTVLVNGGGTVGGPGAFEASLDVQQIAGGAPGASVTLVSVPDLSDDNIMDGYNYIVNSNKYDIVSSSFGGCEQFYLPAYNNGINFTYILQMYEQIFQQGNAEGITFLASSGDNGGLQCTTSSYLKGKAGKFVKGVSTPAASKSVTAVGGTNLVTVSTGSLDSTYVSENGYGDPLVPYDPYGTGGVASGGYWGAGGGKSVIFAKPTAQKGVNTGASKRTVPDIGMQVGGCPSGISVQPCGADRSAAVVAYNGQFYGVIGTSVSSPELAGAIALYIQTKKARLGDVNPFLYQRGQAQTSAGGINAPAASQYYHRNIPGFDGVYRDTVPSVNYNYIVGNGTPDVRKLFDMTQYAPAGIPQTITNP